MHTFTIYITWSGDCNLEDYMCHSKLAGYAASSFIRPIQ